ncbi:MAG: glycerol-3-phosphate acyltransferase [Anaerolineales bacterium]
MGAMFLLLGTLLAAYLIGAIPFAYIVSRLATGVDIRRVGDGNAGAKNTFHSVGPMAGVLVGAADISKGMLAVELARTITGSEETAMVAGMSAVLGHDFSPFLNFHGGQGMASMVGAFLLLFPVPTTAAVVLSLVILGITRNLDAAWTTGFLILIALVIVCGYGWNRVLYTVLLIPTIGVRKGLQILAAHRLRA